jgi:hypothetical protein
MQINRNENCRHQFEEAVCVLCGAEYSFVPPNSHFIDANEIIIEAETAADMLGYWAPSEKIVQSPQPRERIHARLERVLAQYALAVLLLVPTLAYAKLFPAPPAHTAELSKKLKQFGDLKYEHKPKKTRDQVTITYPTARPVEKVEDCRANEACDLSQVPAITYMP